MSLATPEKIQTLQRKLCLKAKREQDIVHASRMNLVREPDAGNPHVRFDERGAETEWMARLSETPTRKGGNGQGSHGLEPSPRRSSTLPIFRVACTGPAIFVRRLRSVICLYPNRPYETTAPCV